MLRDDIERLLKKYLRLAEKKADLLKSISFKEIENRFFTEASDADSLEKNIERIGNMIDEISLLDYELSGIKDNICRKTGMSRDGLSDFFKAGSSTLARGIHTIEKSISESIQKFINDRDRLIQLMEKNINTLAKNIDELYHLRKFDPEKIKKIIDH